MERAKRAWFGGAGWCLTAGALACAALIAACGGGGGEGGDGGSAGAGPGGGPGGGCTIDGQTHTGEGTYYDANGSGNYSFPPSPDDLLVAAMNEIDYAGSAACGACARIDGPDGSVTVRIVDRCPECPQGDVDMSPQAFELIAPLELGRVPMTWEYVACGLDGPIVYHFKEGSNPYWTAVQVRNHRYPIATFEYMDAGGAWREVPRLDYNYFVEEIGMGEGPYSFRVTDVLGQQIEDTGIGFVENGEVAGAAQLPACAP